jgi:putative transposase
MAWLSPACAEGARRETACRAVGLSVRTWQRWQQDEAKADGRTTVVHQPANRLSDQERQRLLEVANTAEFRSLPPSENRPDAGRPWRISRLGIDLLPGAACRGPRRHPRRIGPRPRISFSRWDITYLATTVQGMFFYLYLILDVYSRKIVGLEVLAAESAEHATTVVGRAYSHAKVSPANSGSCTPTTGRP